MVQNCCQLVGRIIRTELPHYELLHGLSGLSVRNDLLSLQMLEPLVTMCGLDLDTMSAELHGLWP